MAMFDEGKYPEETQVDRMAGMQVRTRNVIPRLKAQREELQERLNKIDSLLSLLEKNPGMVQIIDLSRELL